MDVGSAFAEYFEREISVKKRRPRALDSSQRFHRLLHFLSTPVFPRSVFRFFLFRPPRRFFLPPSPPLFFSNPSPLFHGEFHRSLLFPPAPYPPPSPSTRAEDRRAYIGQLPVVSPCSRMLLKQLWTFLSLSLFLLPLFSHPFSFFHSLFSLFPLGLTAAHASDHPGCKKRRVVWTEKRLIFIRSLSFSIVTLCSLFSLCLSLFCSTTRALV